MDSNTSTSDLRSDSERTNLMNNNRKTFRRVCLRSGMMLGCVQTRLVPGRILELKEKS